MSGKVRTSLLSLTIIAVIVFSAFGTTIAYADGGTTPESPATEATTPPEETTTEATEVAAEATSVPEEAPSTPEAVTAEATEVPAEAAAEATSADAATAEPAATDQQPTEEAAPVTDAAAPAADATVLNEVPENTTVTVLDANGESQPLASQDAAAAIETTSDPIWCPAAVASPTPGANGCTDSFTSFDALLTFISGSATYQGAGTIYVQQGAYNGGESNIDFNAYNLSNISNANLTITGGWNTSSGTVDPASTSNFTDTRITVGSSTNPWGGSLSINNISMTFTNANGNIPATPENGLTLAAQGDVSLANVSVTNAPSAGAEIDAGGGVNIENSKFDRNRTNGAIVRSGGNVTISDSSFSNPANGRRQISGLDVTSAGAVTLFNVLANENREAGATINAGGAVTIGSSFFSGTKATQGTGAATTFLGYGLKVVTPGTIAVDSVTANDNFLWGASLQGGSDIAIANSIFNGNTTASPGFIDDTGLFVTGGSIVSLFNVQANDNRLYGAQINATGNVSINQSTFNNNQGVINTGGVDTYNGHGLHITSLADILINNTTANGNMLFGGQLNAGGQVSVANSTFSNTSTGSSANAVGKGLDIVSGGQTSLSSVVLDNNQTSGATIQAGTTWLQDNTVTNNGADGISLQATCTNLIGGTYSGNAQYGLNLGNSALNLLSQPTFSNNGAGDIFPETPATCGFVVTIAPAAATTSGVTSVGASNIFASLQIAPQKSSSSEANASQNSLSSFLANTRTMSSNIHGLFIGNYAYIDSDSGIQVIAFVPATNSVAME